MQNFKILSPASACLRGDRDKIYAPRFKQASSRDEILRRIFKKSRARAPAKAVNLARNFIPPHYLAAIKYACRADAVKFRTALQCSFEVKFRAAVLTVHTRNALHIAQGLVGIAASATRPRSGHDKISRRCFSTPRNKISAACCCEILYYRSLAGSVRAPS